MSPLKSHHIIKGSIKRLPSQGELASERKRKTRISGRTVSWKQCSSTINQPVAVWPLSNHQLVCYSLWWRRVVALFPVLYLWVAQGTQDPQSSCVYSAVLVRPTRPSHLELASCIFLIREISDQSRHQNPTRTWAGNWGTSVLSKISPLHSPKEASREWRSSPVFTRTSPIVLAPSGEESICHFPTWALPLKLITCRRKRLEANHNGQVICTQTHLFLFTRSSESFCNFVCCLVG